MVTYSCSLFGNIASSVIGVEDDVEVVAMVVPEVLGTPSSRGWGFAEVGFMNDECIVGVVVICIVGCRVASATQYADCADFWNTSSESSINARRTRASPSGSTRCLGVGGKRKIYSFVL